MTTKYPQHRILATTMLRHQIASLIQSNKEKDAIIACLSDQVANLQLMSESYAGSMDSSVSNTNSGPAFNSIATKDQTNHNDEDNSPPEDIGSDEVVLTEESPPIQSVVKTQDDEEQSPAETIEHFETAGCLKDVLGGTSMDLIFQPKNGNNQKAKAYRSNSVNMSTSMGIHSNTSLESLTRRRTRDFSGYNSDGATNSRRISISRNGAHVAQHRYQAWNGDCVSKSSNPVKMNSSSSANAVYGSRQSSRGIWNILDKLISTNRSRRTEHFQTHKSFSESNDERCFSLIDPIHSRYNRHEESQHITNFSPAELAFSRWTTDQVCAWMTGIGLSSYTTACRRNIRSGLQILTATHGFLEKELGMKNMLHRKRLLVYLESLCNQKPEPEMVRNLDLFWVQKWLDDIGLPQYKDTFLDAKIDGRMLHRMTIDDLIYMSVTNELHHLSIRRAIQILRLHNFDCDCLKRRPSQDDRGRGVILWSNHRVMEWLRSVDLSEYAPNLRGSGVHGSLVVLEPRFNADTLADILAIPPNKTLLRRHLTTEFSVLVGAESEAKKKEVSLSKSYRRLNIHSKVKNHSKGKYGIFSQSKKSYCDRFDRLICPPITQDSFRINQRNECHKCATTRATQRQFRSASRGAGSGSIATVAARMQNYKSKNSPTTFV
ncbi:hypothetical protein ACOME3_000641 [Neoechinorhynchus agilis]